MTAPELMYSQPDAGEREWRGLPRSTAALALIALIALGLLLRLAELDRILPNEHEARQALAAWRILNPQLPGAQLVPESPLLFALQALLFSVFGASEVTARLPVALGGALLPLLPLLLQSALGRARAFAFCALLAASPVMLLASRQSAPVILSLLLTGLLLWAALRFAQFRQNHHAALATTLLVWLLLLSEPAAIVLALMAGGSLIVALLWFRRAAAHQDPLPYARDLLRSWPTGNALPLALLTAFLVATLFMLNPGGLAAVGELLAAFITGFVTPRPGAIPLQALLVALSFEPLLLLLAVLRLLQLRFREPGIVDRFLIIWTLLAVTALLLWRGAGPEHALWLIVPLAGLASGLVASLRATDEGQRATPLWLTLLAGISSFALLALFSLHLQAFARIADLPAAGIIHLVWMGLALLLLGLGCVWLAQEWGWPAALRACGGGALVLVLAASLGSGWTSAVTRADDPDGMWQVRPAAREARLLRETLQTLAQRESGGFPRLEIYVQTNDQSLVEWLLRDFTRLRFIERASDARGAQILLLPWSAEPPELAGDYVGQGFVMRRARSIAATGPLAGWLLASNDIVAPPETLVLWLRRDIYDGMSQNEGEGLSRQ